MNCQEFTTVAVELARGQLIEATTRDEATRHADGCARCAAQLAQEASLSAALHSARGQMNDVGAPARVEASLLAAFRAQPARTQPAEVSAAAPARTVVAELSTVATRRARFAFHSRRAMWATAVAASLVLAVVAVRRAMNDQQSSEQQQQQIALQPDARRLSPIEPQPSPAQVEAISQPVSSDVETVAASTRTTRHTRAQRTRGGGAEVLPVAFDVDGGLAVGSAPGAGPAEISSEFMTLASAGSSAPLEGGQMVRVQLPRSALAAMGLPVSAERAGESVQADVLLAHDGTARAIRVLPERSQVAGVR